MAEEKKAGPLPGIFQIIGIAACAHATFMGLTYITGDIATSAIGALLAAILLMVLVHFLCYWKAKKQRANSESQNRTPEYTLAVLYGVLFIVLFVISFHYLFIDFSQKKKVQNNGLSKIENIENIASAFEAAVQGKENTLRTEIQTALQFYLNAPAGQKGTYASDLSALLDTHKPNYNLPDNDFKSHVESIIDARAKAERKKYYTEEIDDLNKKKDEYVLEAKEAFGNWKFTKIGYYFSDADRFYSLYKGKVLAVMADFEYQPSTQDEIRLKDPLYSLKNAGGKNLILFAVILMFVHIFILAPYRVTKRPTISLITNRESYTNKDSLTEYLKQKNRS